MMSNEHADRNYAWFKEHLPELERDYDGRYVIIKAERVMAIRQNGGIKIGLHIWQYSYCCASLSYRAQVRSGAFNA